MKPSADRSMAAVVLLETGEQGADLRLKKT
jgi:hypothetical protein